MMTWIEERIRRNIRKRTISKINFCNPTFSYPNVRENTLEGLIIGEKQTKAIFSTSEEIKNEDIEMNTPYWSTSKILGENTERRSFKMQVHSKRGQYNSLLENF